MRALPPIDKSQDWFLISGEEENGFTVLEFSRNLTTCDPKDLEIKVALHVQCWLLHASEFLGLCTIFSPITIIMLQLDFKFNLPLHPIL